jgi:hypothetical protein
LIRHESLRLGTGRVSVLSTVGKRHVKHRVRSGGLIGELRVRP